MGFSGDNLHSCLIEKGFVYNKTQNQHPTTMTVLASKGFLESITTSLNTLQLYFKVQIALDYVTRFKV